jgi:putative ATP-dependent endonuclease of OLD family
MRINYFSVDNFRGVSGGIISNKIEFRDSNTIFIFGQNNVGKSTFLQAYQYFYSNTDAVLTDFYNQDDSLIIVFELEVLFDKYDFERIEKAAPKQKDSFKTYLKNGNVLRIATFIKKNEKGKYEKSNRTWNFVENKFDDIGYGSIGLHPVFQSCMPKPVFIKAMPTEAEAKTILNEILRMIAEDRLKAEDLAELKIAQDKIKELQEKMYSVESIAKYEDAVNSYFTKVFPDTSLSIKDQKSRVLWTENKLGKEFDIEFCKTNNCGDIDTRVPTTVNTIGHGTIRTAIFTLLLMRDVAEEFERKDGRKDYMVLFEEPELFLYPKVVRELRELIYQVSKDELPYQVLCASHSPQMIDLAKPKSSIIRMIKDDVGTKLFQINDNFLKKAKNIASDKELKQAMYEVLRFNPHVCESFYADEVILIEGPTEEIILRAYLQEETSDKDVFILNCGSVTNIPFYQKVLSRFNITYNVICDTDKESSTRNDDYGNPIFDKGIQGAISIQFQEDKVKEIPNSGLFRVHIPTFEPAHQVQAIPEKMKFIEEQSLGKPYNANLYWKNSLQPNLSDPGINNVPIIKYIKEILNP